MLQPKTTLHLRSAALSDIDGIDRIEREAFSTPWSRDLLRAAIVNRQYTVQALSEDGRLVGFYIAHTVQRRSNLDNLAVDAPERRQGHGRRLMQDWMLRARGTGLNGLTLQVNTANAVAQQLYESYGFRTTRLLVAYYPNGDDAYQMELALSEQPADGGDPAPPEKPRGAARSGRLWFGRRSHDGRRP